MSEGLSTDEMGERGEDELRVWGLKLLVYGALRY
jgi:hypothetical protein